MVTSPPDFTTDLTGKTPRLDNRMVSSVFATLVQDTTECRHSILVLNRILIPSMEKEMANPTTEKPDLPVNYHLSIDCPLGSTPIVCDDSTSVHRSHSDCIRSQAKREFQIDSVSGAKLIPSYIRSTVGESEWSRREREFISNNIRRVTASLANALGLDPCDCPVPTEVESDCSCPRPNCSVHKPTEVYPDSPDSDFGVDYSSSV